MAGPTAVTHTELYPTHDITLSDGTDSVGFIFCDGMGNPMPNFDRVGMPSDALLASQGESEYSTLSPGTCASSRRTGAAGADSPQLIGEAVAIYRHWSINTHG